MYDVFMLDYRIVQLVFVSPTIVESDIAVTFPATVAAATFTNIYNSATPA